jgi:hypothetical protein
MSSGAAMSHRVAPIPAYVRWARIGYTTLAWGLLAGVVAEVFLAGLGVFVAPGNYAWHAAFAGFVLLLSLLLLIDAFVTRWHGLLRWLPLAMFGLIVVQGATAAAAGSLLAALHPVNALLVFWLALEVARRATASLRQNGV